MTLLILVVIVKPAISRIRTHTLSPQNLIFFYSAAISKVYSYFWDTYRSIMTELTQQHLSGVCVRKSLGCRYAHFMLISQHSSLVKSSSLDGPHTPWHRVKLRNDKKKAHGNISQREAEQWRRNCKEGTFSIINLSQNYFKERFENAEG